MNASTPQSTTIAKASDTLLDCEIARSCDFTKIRYSQCWEDADVLLKALDFKPGSHILSICSAGDNTLSLLTGAPGKVTAVDVSAAQLALLELKSVAFRMLSHEEVLILIGVTDGDRLSIYARLRDRLSHPTQALWDARKDDIRIGLGHIGKFERYFAVFRRYALPLVHSRKKVDKLLSGSDRKEREEFFKKVWNSASWRAMFRIFFSRKLMGFLGRDPAFFRYVQGGIAQSLLERTEYALTVMNPSENPYLRWILTGTYGNILPHYLRPENFEAIRNNLDKLEWQQSSLEAYLRTAPHQSIDGFNLSDVFEYTAPEKYHELLRRLINCGSSGARLVYWNMLAPRTRPPALADFLHSHDERARSLFCEDKAFFYSKLVIEEII